jgi:hypothetical protein
MRVLIWTLGGVERGEPSGVVEPTAVGVNSGFSGAGATDRTSWGVKVTMWR